MGRKTRKEWRREEDDEGFVGQRGGVGGFERYCRGGWRRKALAKTDEETHNATEERMLFRVWRKYFRGW